MDARKLQKRQVSKAASITSRQLKTEVPSDYEKVNGISDNLPLTPRQVLQLQRAIGNQAVLRHLQRQVQIDLAAAKTKLQRDVQPPATSLNQKPSQTHIIQRSVGYEFQTNWGVIYNPGTFQKRRKFRKGEILKPYAGFNMTADDAGTRLGAELEWVVDPPIPESESPQTVAGIIHRLQEIASLITSFQNQDVVDLGKATGDATLKGVEAYPKIKGADAGKDMKANPQVSGGIRLDQIMQLMEDVKTAHAGSDTDRGQELKTSGMAKILTMLMAEEYNITGYVQTQVAKLQHPDPIPGISGRAVSKAMKGYIAMALTYLSQGRRGYNNGPLPYVKAFTIMLARTDFGSMFNMLPEEERSYYAANSGKFVDLVLNTINSMSGTGGELMLTKGIMTVPNEPDKGKWDLPLTRAQWLTGLSQGIDLLSTYHLPAQKANYESLGALGSKTDKVRSDNPINAPVFEFRKVKQQIPVSEWGIFARGIFEYLSSINSGETEDEADLRQQQEYQEYMRKREDDI